MKSTMFILGLLIAGCAAPPAQPPESRVLRDRRPEMLSRSITGTSPSRGLQPPSAHTPPATRSADGDVFPGGTVPPLDRPTQPSEPARLAPQPDADWERASPTDPASRFDRRFKHRNAYDDLNRMDPQLRDPPASIWERDFSPERK